MNIAQEMRQHGLEEWERRTVSEKRQKDGVFYDKFIALLISQSENKTKRDLPAMTLLMAAWNV